MGSLLSSDSLSSGNVIRYATLRALQLPVQAWLRLAIYNTGMTHICQSLEIRRCGVRCELD
jgi:hypothetical protein